MRDLFARSGLEPHIVFSGVDVDVVKAFVEAGLGVAVLPRIAYEPQREPKLRALDVGHLFESHSGCLAIRKNHYLRGYVYEFIEMLTAGMDRRAVSKALEAARGAVS
jgi:DNA-binding transcriptional LysR family regulator